MADLKFRPLLIRIKAMGRAIIPGPFLVDCNLAKMLKVKMMVNHKWFRMKINRATTILIMTNRMAYKCTTKSEMASRQSEATLSIHIYIIIFLDILSKALEGICNTICPKCISTILRVVVTHLIFTKHLCQEVPTNILNICSTTSMLVRETSGLHKITSIFI
jgi:hypothetical protein